jgi:Leucine-rich repeat (LRR) protein
MPIDAALLERIKANDPTLTTLDLSNKKLNDSDIQQLANALATNTNLTNLDVGWNQIGDEGAKALAANATLTNLDVGGNQIGVEGAKALAANATLTNLNVYYNQIGAKGAKALAANTTLTNLDVWGNQIGDEGTKALAANATLTYLNVRSNQIGDEGAKALAANATLTNLDVGWNLIGDEGAKALAANAALTSLNVRNNQIGAEGAKALAANSTLTTLNVEYNEIDDEGHKQLELAIERNNQQVVKRLDQFIQKLILLAHDKVDEKNQSSWFHLPKEIKLHIVDLIDFRSASSIGKSVQQINACAAFIFNHVPQLKESLTAATNTKQDFKIMEKITGNKSQFQFFPPIKPQIELPANLSKEESKDQPNEIHQTI